MPTTNQVVAAVIGVLGGAAGALVAVRVLRGRRGSKIGDPSTAGEESKHDDAAVSSGEAGDAMIDSLSNQGRQLCKPFVPYMGDMFRAMGDLYDPESNPDGSFLFCVAENRLRAATLAQKLHDTMVEQGASKCVTVQTTSYGDPCGLLEFRAALTAVLQKTCVKAATLDPKCLLMQAGCSAAIGAFTMCVCDEGDAVLVPTPCYAAFKKDVYLTPRAVLVPMPLAHPDYEVSVSTLEQGVRSAERQGRKVGLVLLTNPSNPLGTSMSFESLVSVVEWCCTHRVHVLVDEIYGISEFPDAAADATAFVSIVDVVHGLKASNPSKASLYDTFVHAMWGLSKDFATSGFRVGGVYTHNTALARGFGGIAVCAQASNFVMHMMGLVFRDVQWTLEYLQGNIKALKSNCDVVTRALDAADIPFTVPTAAMFVWLDLRKFLPRNPTFEDESALLAHVMSTAKCVLTPGSACMSPVPGFARLCFGYHPLEAMHVGMKRLVDALVSYKP